MAQLIKPPRFFTHEEWMLNNHIKFASVEKEREHATSIENESDRLIDETDKRTQKTLEDVNKKIDQRLKDEKYWKGEIDKKLNDMTNETNNLEQYFSRLNRALEATHEPLHYANQCLINRSKRQGIDLVSDDVHKELIKETEVIKGIQSLLQKSLEQAKEQIRLNRKQIFNLKNQSSDKLEAQHIDEYCRTLKPGQDVRGVDLVKNIRKKSFTPEEWQDFAIDQIQNTDKQIHNSKELRGILDGILQQIATDQKNQIAATNRKLQKRISETRDAKGELEEHLALVLKEISHIEDTIVDLEKAIQDKAGTKRLAEIRKELRKERPNVENCRDPASYRILQELDELTMDEAQLADRWASAHARLKGLCRQQLGLEEEIAIKSNTLFIDEVECLGLRKTLQIHAY